jgi:hypothetical protein
MYKKDLITAEIEKLAQVLAKIKDLNVALKLEDAEKLFDDTMINSFGLASEIFKNANLPLFKNWLTESNLSAEKLDSLSEFLYYELGLNSSKNQIIAPKLNMIYEQLAIKHKIVHLVNLHRQQTIQQYL